MHITKHRMYTKKCRVNKGSFPYDIWQLAYYSLFFLLVQVTLEEELVCPKCEKKRTERREIITEIVQTEIKYGHDLRIVKEEFYKPIETAGLLTKLQLEEIFLNLDELIEVNASFSEKLQDALDIASEQGDEVYAL